MRFNYLYTICILIFSGIIFFCKHNLINVLADKNFTKTSTLSFSKPMMPSVATDSIKLPPLQRKFYSQNQSYLFLVSTKDNWQSNHAIGELLKLTNNKYRRLWVRELPQQYGPRYVSIGNQGQIALIDESMNLITKYAILVLNYQNSLVAQYDFNEVSKIIGVKGSSIVATAKYGSWITSPPIIYNQSQIVKLGVANKILIISLDTGKLKL